MTNEPMIEKDRSIEELARQIYLLLEEGRGAARKAVDSIMVSTYFTIGRMIVEFKQEGRSRARYGAETLKNLSKHLRKYSDKSFSVDTLENIRRFYLVYHRPISEAVPRKSSKGKSEAVLRKSQHSDPQPEFKLSWTHYLVLIRIKNPEERSFYEIEAFRNSWSTRELKRQYDSSLYERLALSRDKKGMRQLARDGQLIEQPKDLMKEPLVLEFLGLREEHRYSETDLEARIISRLEEFLLELGKGFSFVARQKRITDGERHFYIDLVFYNRLLNCFFLIDLKLGELKHQDIGQMQMYVNYFDREVRTEGENRTIGLILCKDKSDFVVKYTLPENNDQIFSTRYRLCLPSKEELRAQIAMAAADLPSEKKK